jgi:hypothetical protein
LRFLHTMFTSTLQATFKRLLLKRGGGRGEVKFVRRGDCEKQGGKLLRLFLSYVQEFGLR